MSEKLFKYVTENPRGVAFNQLYTADRLKELRENKRGDEMRKFICLYHAFRVEGIVVPPHWEAFADGLLLRAAMLTGTNVKAREGLLAKEMGLQGGGSNSLRDASIAITVQQYRKKGMERDKAFNETSQRALKAGFNLGYDAVRKIWDRRDKEDVEFLAEKAPDMDVILGFKKD